MMITLCQPVKRSSSSCFLNSTRFLIRSRGSFSNKCRSISARISGDSSAESKRQDAESVAIKPFSAVPTDNTHWILNALEVFLRYGGFHKSFFKIQEKVGRVYGPIVKRTNVATGYEVWLYDPQDIATVYRTEPNYPKRFDLSVLEDFYARRSKQPGVFFLNGKTWHKHKSLMSKKMLRPFEINQYIPRINGIASEMVSRISKVRNSETDSKPFEVNHIDMELFKWSFETVVDFLFDRRFNSLDDNPPEEAVTFIKAVGGFLDSIAKVGMFPVKLFRYYESKAFKEFDRNLLLLYKIADELIEEKLNEISTRKDRNDNTSELIPFLLSSERISEEEIGSSIVDTLFAGVDTTSNTMQWVLYFLAKYPKVQSRIRDEILRVLPGDTEPDSSSLQRLPLVKAATKETLRLKPVLIVNGRVLEQDAVLSGFRIPANTPLMMMHHAMGRNEKVFENSLEFAPERWLRDGMNRKAQAYASIPFGHGVRMCLGRRLAELELQILLINILKRYTLDIPPEHVVEGYFRGVNIPDRPIRVKFLER